MYNWEQRILDQVLSEQGPQCKKLLHKPIWNLNIRNLATFKIYMK